MKKKNQERCPGTFVCEKSEHAAIYLESQKEIYQEAFHYLYQKGSDFKKDFEWIALIKKKYEHYRNEISRLGGNVSKIPAELNYMETRN